MNTKRMGLAEAKAKFSAIVEGVVHRDERYLIERHGRGVAALVSVEDFQQLERSRPSADRAAGAMALVGLWQDLADDDRDVVFAAVVRTREGNDGRAAEFDA